MGYMTTTVLAFGIILSSVAGLLCYLGVGSVAEHLGWLPQSDILFAHPRAALGAGGFMTFVGVFCQSTRIK